MKRKEVAEAYRTQQFEGASPLKILQMLNAGAIRYLKAAQESEPDAPEYRENLLSAEAIVNELRASLDHEPNPELSANLDGLYLFMGGELGRAMLEGDESGIENSIQVLTTLLDGWNKAARQLQADGMGQVGQGHVA